MAQLDKKILEELKNDSQTRGKQIEDLTSGLKKAEFYMIGIAVVATFGFVSLLLTGWAFFSDSLNFKASTYQVLVDKVNEINKKIDYENEIKYKNEIDSLKLQIDNLRQKNPYLK